MVNNKFMTIKYIFLSLRCFGGSRFTIWALGRLLFLRKYRAKLFYTTKDINIKNIKLTEDLPEEDWNKMDGIIILI